jgi:hypothetical protein
MSVRRAATVPPSMASRFPNLESSVLADRDARTASRWPGSVLRRIYTRIGASERINPRRLVDVDLAASPFAERYPKRRYPAILLGCGRCSSLTACTSVPGSTTTAKANGAPQVHTTTGSDVGFW